MARSKKWEGTIQDPEGFPTDRQFWTITNLLRQNPEVKVPKFPVTRLEASKLIDNLKSRTTS